MSILLAAVATLALVRSVGGLWPVLLSLSDIAHGAARESGHAEPDSRRRVI